MMLSCVLLITPDTLLKSLNNKIKEGKIYGDDEEIYVKISIKGHALRLIVKCCMRVVKSKSSSLLYEI